MQQIFSAPREPYTQALLDAVPKLGAMAGTDGPQRTAGSVAEKKRESAISPIVEVDDLTVRFDIRGGLLQRVVARVHAVEGVSFV